MWNEDVVKLVCALVEIDLNPVTMSPILDYCVEVVGERNVPLDSNQEKRFKDALNDLNYSPDDKQAVIIKNLSNL